MSYLALLAACTQPPRADWDLRSETACRGRGLNENSEAYLNCRMEFAHQHAQQFGIDEPLRQPPGRR